MPTANRSPKGLEALLPDRAAGSVEEGEGDRLLDPESDAFEQELDRQLGSMMRQLGIPQPNQAAAGGSTAGLGSSPWSEAAAPTPLASGGIMSPGLRSVGGTSASGGSSPYLPPELASLLQRAAAVRGPMAAGISEALAGLAASGSTSSGIGRYNGAAASASSGMASPEVPGAPKSSAPKSPPLPRFVAPSGVTASSDAYRAAALFPPSPAGVNANRADGERQTASFFELPPELQDGGGTPSSLGSVSSSIDRLLYGGLLMGGTGGEGGASVMSSLSSLSGGSLADLIERGEFELKGFELRVYGNHLSWLLTCKRVPFN